MARRERDYLGRMARTHPVRTALFTAGPILFGLVQLVDSYLNDGSLLYAATVCGVMAAFAAMATRYHLVSFRIARLNEDLDLAD